MSNDNAFIRVKKGVYTLRCWADQLPPQLDQGAAGASGGAKVGGMLSSGCVWARCNCIGCARKRAIAHTKKQSMQCGWALAQGLSC